MPLPFTVTVQTVVFDIPLLFSEIDYFRKAVSSVVRKLRTPLLQEYIAPDLFYNHDDATGSTINRYPLIQYKIINNQAAITGMNAGATAVKVLLKLLQQKQHYTFNNIHIHGRDASLQNHMLQPVQQQSIAVLPEMRSYTIKNWLPLEEERYQIWKSANTLQIRKDILNEALIKQLANLLRGAGYNRELTYSAGVEGEMQAIWLKEFNVHKLAFDGRFVCNLSLPVEMGIGQVPSIGFGGIYQAND